MAKRLGRFQKSLEFERNALDLEKCIWASIAQTAAHRQQGCIPASTYRRMDAGAIGSLVADYPLQITGPAETLISNTADYLMVHCCQCGAFFQDLIHSGINAYLTLAIAQTLLRQDDVRYRKIVETVVGLVSPTGQWPEAIHPLTGGGCMGDGQHGWAAAEWVMMMRNLFVREEGQTIVIGSGIFPQWLDGSEPIAFGPTSTPAGRISVSLSQKNDRLLVDIDAETDDMSTVLEIAVPGFAKKKVPITGGQHMISRT